MYAAPHFRESDAQALLDAIAGIGAVSLVTTTADGLHATLMPVLVAGTTGEPMLIGHIARANPQWRVSLEDGPAMAIATGPNTYVSPNAYPTKASDPRVVPTWNYVHIQAHGHLAWVDDPAEKLAIVTMLTDHHEAGRSDTWASHRLMF